MEFIVMNRQMVQDGRQNDINVEFVIISIYSPELGPPNIRKTNNIRAILNVECHDVDYDEKGNITAQRGFVDYDDADIIPFNDKIAQNIVDFVKKYDPLIVVIHCDAGLSRSPAVALALSKIYNSNAVMPEMFVRSFVGGMGLYNRFIYSKILNKGIRSAKEPI